MRVEFCYGCGAPLEARWSEIVIVCRHCGAQNAPGGKSEPVPSSVPDDGQLRLSVDGRVYLVLGKLAEGDSSDVYFGRWVRRLGEQVTIKVLRCSADRDLLMRESSILYRLRNSPAAGTPHFSGLIPEPIATGPTRIGDSERQISVFRWRSGFIHSAEEVKTVYPDGIDPRVSVWVFKRLLEILHWTHQSRVVHGAVLPPHILIHPRDHGAMLVGWGTAITNSSTSGSPLPAVSRVWKGWYANPESFGLADDVAFAARSVLWLSGATSLRPGGTFPLGLAEIMEDALQRRYDDAWQLRDVLTARALETLGPPKYSPLNMPGWSEFAAT